MKRIPVGRRHIALVSNSDYAWLSRFRWWLKRGRNTLYARTRVNGKQVSMHQLIKPVKRPFVIDHRNRNGLHNQRHNLRKATITQNSKNRKLLISGKVHWYSQRSKWRVVVDKKYIGLFSNRKDARKARDQAMGV